MAAKLALSKIKGKPASSAPFTFRFLPNEEDLEEVTTEDQDVEKQDETTNVFKPSNTYPTSLEKVATETEVLSIPHSLSTDSNEMFRESFSDVCSLQNCMNEGIAFASDNSEHDKYSSSLPSEPCKQPSESTHNVRVKDVRDSSPMKESVKDYLVKLGKKSSSLENSPATENDNWSLFNELKGRITKTFEEKISRESSISSKSVEKPNIQPSSQKSTQPSSPVEMISNDDEVADCNDNSVSSPGSAISERKFASVDSIDSDRKSMSSEDQLPLFIENDSKSITSVDDDLEDNSDMGKCIILPPNSGQKKTASTIGSSAQALLSPKRPLPNMSVTLSSLMAAKVLDSDSMEETQSELDTPNSENLEMLKEKSLTKQIITESSNVAEKLEVNITKHPSSDNMAKTLNKHKLFQEIQHSCRNLKSCWQKQMLALIVAFVACIVAPIPSFLSGLLSGILLSSLTGWLLWQLFQPVATKEPLNIPDYTNLPPLVIPMSSEQSTDIYKGWMNELPFEYNPETYQVSNTKSVYIRLDGTSLRLSHPKSNIPKRAMWNETRHDPVFIHQRYYDLAGAIISLLPEGLARKRLWSKKYPIYLEVFNSPTQLHQGESDSLKKSLQRNSFGSTNLSDSSDDSDEKELTVKQTHSVTSKIYLFARTSRDKEEWYWLLQQATKQKTNWLKSSLSGSNQSSQVQPTLKDQRSFSMDLGTLNVSSYGGGSVLIDLPSKEIPEINKLDFNQYISPFLDNEMWLKNFSSFPPVHLKDKKQTSLEPKSSAAITSKENMLWLNALIGRIFFNFLTEQYWRDEVTDRIQKKLSKIRVPYFIQELKLTDINLGNALPQIRRTSDPAMDNKGLWIDLDITYNGSFQMTLETKLNLLRLKRRQGVEMDDMSGIGGDKCSVDRSSRSYIQNSEEEDSAESSSDDEISSEMAEHGNLIKASVSQHISSSGTSTSKKLLRIVDKIAQSRCFQQATENKYIKKYMEDVSNTPLFLTVEVNGLIGTLAINIPPLPTDRLWYGFRTNPQLSISARPKLGERQVTLAPVTDWIEKKLALEFQKILVMPNMDDLIIPIMSGANIPSSLQS